MKVFNFQFRFLAMLLTFTVATLAVQAQFSNVPLTAGSFNSDVVAEGTTNADASATSTDAVDGTLLTNFVFVTSTFKPSAAASACSAAGFPASITSSNTTTNTGITYPLQSPTGSNAQRIVGGGSGTITPVTPFSAATLYLVCLGGNGATNFNVQVNFVGGTSETITGNSAPDWCGGAATNKLPNATTPTQYYRIARNATTCTGAGCQYLYELPVNISPANYSKTISSITFTNTGSNVFLHVFALGMKATCVTPVDQASGLTQGVTSTSSIAGSFTAAPSAPNGYLVVGYPAGASPVTPANGTTYTAGQVLGTGRVIQSAATTSFTANGLTGGTSYDVYVYAYNAAANCGGPMYNVTSVPMATWTTNSCTGLAGGTYSVGPTGFFTSLGAALTTIGGGITGPVILELQATYVSSVESFPLTFPSNACIGPVNTLTIRPVAGATNLSLAANTTGALNFSGAAYVTIDGRAGGVGSSQLTISNVGTGYDIQFINDAYQNTIKYCTLTSRNTSTAGGTIMFGAGVSFGNDNNTIDNCTITDDNNGTFPANAIYSAGTSTAIDNSSISITNCNISNYFSAALVSNGILLTGTGNSGWNISNNRFFQTSTRLYTSPNTHNAISVLVGSGYTINNNIIGFANASGTGTTNLIGNSVTLAGFPSSYATTGTATATRYIGINCAFTAGGTVSNIQGNTIAGFALYTSSGAATTNGIWCGINLTSGNANIGTTAANVIGATSGLASVYAASTTTGGQVVGIYATSTNTVAIQNNSIGAFDASGTTASINTGITAIDAAGTGGIFSINGNTIGNSGAGNMRTGFIQNGANLGAGGSTLTTTTGSTGFIMGIRCTASGATLSVNSNTIQGFITSSTIAAFTGITSTGTLTTSVNINNNFLGTAGAGLVNYLAANSGSLIGINCTGATGATVHSIQNNDFRGITNAVASSHTHTYLTLTGATAGGDVATIAGNTFTNLNVNTTGTITFLSHSYVIAGTGQFIFNNNSIVTGFTRASAGALTLTTTASTSSAGAIANYTNNNFSNIVVPDNASSTILGFNNTDGGSVKQVTGNTFNNWHGGTAGTTGSSGTINCFNFNNWTGAASLSSNTVTNITGRSNVTGITIGSTTNTANPLNMNSNTVTGLASVGTGGTVTGITCANTSTVVNINTNTINNLSSTGATVTGLAITGATNTTVSGNNISLLSSSNASGTVNGLLVSGGTLVTVTGNNVFNLSTSGITSPLINGISITGGTTINLVKNKIYNISASQNIFSTAGAVKGISLGGGTTVNCYNNLIGDLTAPASSLGDAIRGISVTSTTASSNYNVYYNSIYLNASSSGSPFGTTGIYHTASTTATTAKLDLRNNIVINNSTPSGAAIISALTRSAANTYANYAVTSNRNLYYAGTPGPQNAYLNDNGTVYGTAAASYAFGPFATAGSFQNQVTSTREANSFGGETFAYSTPGAFFQSLTGSSANYLHLVNNITTQAESGGAQITTPNITDDYDGDARNVSTPDVGADEFTGITPSPSVVLNSIAPSGTQCAATSRSVAVDATTPAGTITGVMITYNFNGTNQGNFAMTNSSGNTWTYSIPASTPTNALVTWSVTATNSSNLNATYTGTSYSDDPLASVTVTAAASANPICAGVNTNLSVSLSSGTATAYLWNNSSTTNPTSVAPTTTTNYSCTVTSLGCTKTSNTVTVTVNQLPTAPTATNSTQCGIGIPAASVASTSGAAAPQFFWYSAASGGTLLQSPPAGALQNYYTNDFTSAVLTNSSLAGAAAISGGVCALQPTATSTGGSILVNASGVNSLSFQTDFDLGVISTGTQIADGFSYSLGDDAIVLNNSTVPTAEHGSGTKLRLCFLTYNPASGSDGKGIYLGYNVSATTGFTSATPGMLAYSTNVSWIPTSATTVNSHITMTINAAGQLTLMVGATTIFNNVQLPAGYLSADKSAWKHIICSRSGGVAGGFTLDNLVIKSSGYGTGYTTYQNSISTPTTFYVIEKDAIGCESSPRTPVFADVTYGDNVTPTATVSNNPVTSVCLGNSFVLGTSQTGPNSNAYTYTFSASPAAGSGIPTTVSGGTFASPAPVTITPTAAGTYVYTVSYTDGVCNGINTITITASALPLPFNVVSSANNFCGSGTFNLTAGGVAFVENFETFPLTQFGITNITNTYTATQNTTYFAQGASSVWLNTASVSSNGALGTTSNFDLTPFTSAQLTFKHICGMEFSSTTTYDYGYVEYSTNGGSSWTTFPTSSYAGTGTLFNSVVSFNSRSYANWISNFTSSASLPNNTLWQTETINIPAVALTSNQFRIRFRYTTDISTNYYGWLIDNVQISGGGTLNNYSWTSSPAGFTSNVQNPTNVTANTTTTYTAVATNAFGCTSSASTTVNVTPLPAAPTASAASSQCGFGIPTVSVSSNTGAGAPVYKWYSASSGGTLLQSGASSTYTSNILSTTTFYVAELFNGCESTRTPVQANVTPADAIAIVTNNASCVGTANPFSLNQTGSNQTYTTYTWSAIPAAGSGVSGNPTGATQNFTATANGNYNYVVVATDGNCTTVDTQLVSIYTGLTGTASATQITSCVNPTGLITANVSGAGTVVNNDFSNSSLPSYMTVQGTSTSITGGRLQVTPSSGSQSGGVLIQNTTGIATSDFQVDFDFVTTPSGGVGPADGLSYSYGDDVVIYPSNTGDGAATCAPENGSGTKLKLSFDAINNTGGCPAGQSNGNAAGIYLMYNCTTIHQGILTQTCPGVLYYSNDLSWRATSTTGATTHITITINALGQVSMKLNNVTVVNNVQLPASYLAADKSNWKHAFAARTGGGWEGHYIDNLLIQYNNFYEYSINGGSSWSQTNPIIPPTSGTYSVDARYVAVPGCFANLGSVTINAPSFTTTTTQSNICAYSTTQPTLSFTPSFGTGAAYQWQSSPAGANTWTPLAGETNTTYTPAQGAITVNTDFRCVITCGGVPIPGSPTSTTTISVVAPTVTNTTPNTRCGIGTVILNATADVGSILNWYDASTGGTLLGTGTAFTTPVISAPATYYVAAANGTCESPRTAVLANVTPAPTLTVTSGSSLICAGYPTTVSVTSSNDPNYTYSWTSSPAGFTATGAGPHTVNPPGATTYNVSAIDNTTGSNQGCAAIGSVTINTNPTPATPTMTPPTVLLCEDDTVKLKASGQVSINSTFGTQAAQNAQTGYPAPYTIYYGAQRMQMLITAAELNAAGYAAGSQFTGIKFPVVSLGANWGAAITSCNSFQVSIGSTALTSLTAFQSGLTQVVAPANYTPAVGYNNTHTFSSAFVWNGTSNIIVETTFGNGITGTIGDEVIQYNTPTSYQSTIVYRADGVTAAAAATATTVTLSFNSRSDFKLTGTTGGPVTWSPVTDLFDDSLLTTPYVAGSLRDSVYSHPSVTRTYTATATLGTCSSSNTVTVTVDVIPQVNITPSGVTTYCPGNSVTLNASTNPSYTNYAWTPGGPSGSSATSFTVSGGTNTTTIYRVTATGAGGCTSHQDIPVTVYDTVQPAITVVGNTNLCTGQTTSDLQADVVGVTGPATSYLWSTGETTNLITVTTGAVYSVTTTDIHNCVTHNQQVITESAAPTPPIITPTGTINLCSNDGGATFNTITLSVTNYTTDLLWSTSETTTSISVDYPDVFNVTYTDASGCYSVSNSVVTNAYLSSDAPTGASSDAAFNNICLGNTVTLSVNGGSLGDGADWHWYEGSCNTTPRGTGATITLTPSTAGTHVYYVRAEGICNTTTCATVTITVNTAPPAFGSYINPTPAAGCNGSVATMSGPVVTGAAFYNWSCSQGGVLFNGVPGPVQTATPSVSVTFVNPPAGGLSGYSICMFAGNACGQTQTFCRFVRAKVGQPSPINGSNIGCPNTNGTFSVPAVTGADTYTWTITGNATINGGTATFTSASPSVTVNFLSGWSSGTLTVYASLACGYNSPTRSMSISNTPAIPGTMTGPGYVCPSASATFSVAPVTGAATYNWSTSVAGAIITPAGNSASILFPATIPAGSTICVTAVSSCGSASAQRCKSIANGIPNVPAAINGPASGQCGQSGTSYSITPVFQASSYLWTATGGATVSGPNNLSAVTINFPSTFTTCTLSVVASNSCGTSAARTLVVSGKPAQPGPITGNVAVCANTVETYTTTGAAGATSYNWTSPAGSTILSSPPYGASILIQWGTTGGNVTVAGVNDCGTSPVRTLAVAVTCREGQLIGSADAAASLYPNPTGGKTTLKFESAGTANYSITVSDVTGRIIISNDITAVEGTNMHELDLSTVAKGMYMVRVESDGVQTQLLKVTVE